MLSEIYGNERNQAFGKNNPGRKERSHSAMIFPVT